MRTKWSILAVGLLVLGGVAGVAQISGHRLSEEEAFVQEFPDALIYKGVGLFRLGDYPGAVEAWERYLKVAPRGADTVSIREMIAEANAASKKGGRTGR
ncbi:MAG: tetratricopeptide repeat protein [Gemmatimonadetes bacterium]|nr:tetratricopeptide repeat protein [Gemmatimonadota bacterium]